MENELQERIKQASLPVIAARIREARGSMSHDTLGERMGGVYRQHLIKLEKGKHRPRAEMLTRIAEATGRPVDWFLGEEAGEPSPFRGDGRAAA